MPLLFRILMSGNLVLLLTAATAAYWRPAGFEAPEALHMPLGLLTCVVTVLVQAFFFSYLLTSAWDIEHVAAKQEKAPELAPRCHALKRRGIGLVMVPALSVVATGILGMAVLIGLIPGHVHAAVASLVVLGTLAGIAWAPGVAAALEEIGAELGLQDAAEQELGNR